MQVADLNDSTRNDDALMMAPAYLEGQPGTVDCINVRPEGNLAAPGFVDGLLRIAQAVHMLH